MGEASRRLSGRCGCPWRTCPTKPMKTSDAAFGRSRGVIGTRSKRQRRRPKHEPGFPTRPVVGPTAGQVAMLVWLEQFLVRYPELALFLVIAAGYWIGSFKIGAFSLGPVTGALFAGLFVGHFAEVPVSSMTKSFLFLLFLFGIGYSVGPQFMQALRRDGLKPILLAIVICSTGLVTTIVVAKVLGLDPGFAAGLLSGALTQSAAMGTATDAINALPVPDAQRALFVAHIAVADAVCYIFGYAGVILFVTVIVPALLKFDMKTEALNLERTLGMTRAKPGLASAWRKFELRAYRVDEKSPLVGLTVAAAEARASEHRLFIHRVRRGERILEAEPGMVLEAGDIIA